MGKPILFKLTTVISKPDRAGGMLAYFTFEDIVQEKKVSAQVGNVISDSNIYGIVRHWNEPDDWDRSIIYQCHEDEPIRQFNNDVKGMESVSGTSKDLAAFIRKRLYGEGEA